jgi:hypothetical protein
MINKYLLSYLPNINLIVIKIKENLSSLDSLLPLLQFMQLFLSRQRCLQGPAIIRTLHCSRLIITMNFHEFS